MSSDQQKITELQNTIVSLQATVATLSSEIARLSTKPFHQVMKTSIPLRPMQPSYQRRAPFQEQGRRPYREMHAGDAATSASTSAATSAATSATSSTSASAASASTDNRRMVSLSDIITTNEEVTFYVNTGKDAKGEFTKSTVVTTFDGSNLNVTRCDHVSSLVGLQTQKPGEILYKFIEELKNSNHIKRTFNVAPWKLCYVVRDGQTLTLDQLRNNLPQ
jgi:multidrug resistance efflux pump